MNALERAATDLGAKIATSLVERALVAAIDHSATSKAVRAQLLAELAPSPPDLASDYGAARRALLGDDDEITR